MSCLMVFGVKMSMVSCFFFNDTATTEIYTLSLHDSLPIYRRVRCGVHAAADAHVDTSGGDGVRSEEHTSELQSPKDLVCRLLLEKKQTPRTKRPQLPYIKTHCSTVTPSGTT